MLAYDIMSKNQLNQKLKHMVKAQDMLYTLTVDYQIYIWNRKYELMFVIFLVLTIRGMNDIQKYMFQSAQEICIR